MIKKTTILLILTIILNLPSFASSKSEVKNLLKQHNSALKNHDAQKVKTFYSKDYISGDGFNLDSSIEMLEKTYQAYKNIKYKTKIHTITAYDNWAMAQMSDKTFAKVYPNNDKKYKKKSGYLSGKSTYNVYLKKDNGDWKIIHDDITTEETALVYGVAKKIDMELITPMFIKNNQEYDVSLKMNKPEDIIALGSISREEISYPISDYDEKFRKISPTGDLQRQVKANNKNLDEYAIASVGFTKVSIDEQRSRAKIEITGMAYLMKRINMEKTAKKEILVENKKK